MTIYIHTKLEIMVDMSGDNGVVEIALKVDGVDDGFHSRPLKVDNGGDDGFHSRPLKVDDGGC